MSAFSPYGIQGAYSTLGKASPSGAAQTSLTPQFDPFQALQNAATSTPAPTGGTSGSTDPGAGYSSYPVQPPTAGGWQNDPSAWLENAFGQYGSQYQGGTNTQGYYNSLDLSSPSALSSLYGQMTQAYGNPSATSQALSATASALGGPGNTQSAFDQIGSSFLDPTASSMVLSGAAQQLGGPSDSASRYQQVSGLYDAPTAIGNLAASNPYAQTLGGETLGRNALGMYGNSTASQDILGSMLSQASVPSELAQHQGQIGGDIGSANYMQQFAGNNAGQLSGPGALEQFAASALNQTNPYYDLIGKEGRAAIDQSAAARGAYGAGGSLAALGNYQSHLDAENFQNMGQLQGAAQQAQNARLGLGANVAQGASSEALAQGNALQNLYQNMFGDRMTGAQLGLSAAGQSDQANMARLAGITSMTGLGDQATLGRLAGQTGLANDASTSALNYLNSGMNAAGQSDASTLARTGLLGTLAGQSDQERLAGLAGYANLANQSDQSQLARYGLIGSLAGQSDQTDLARQNSLLSAAGQTDANLLARQGLGLSAAGQADTQGLNWLNSYFNQAGAAQSSAQTRINDELNQLFQSAALQAGLYSNFYGAGGQQSVEAGTGSATAGVGAANSAAAASQQGTKNAVGIFGSIWGA